MSSNVSATGTILSCVILSRLIALDVVIGSTGRCEKVPGLVRGDSSLPAWWHCDRVIATAIHAHNFERAIQVAHGGSTCSYISWNGVKGINRNDIHNTD